MHATIQSRFAPILYVVIFFAGFLTACLWFNPKDYLADLAPVVAAVCAVALVWLAWTAVSVIARKKNEWLRREKLIQQEKVHPVLHASLQSVEEQPATGIDYPQPRQRHGEKHPPASVVRVR